MFSHQLLMLVVCVCSCLQCIVEWQMKKVQATLGNIMSLDSAAITVNNRLTALRTTHSLRLNASVYQTDSQPLQLQLMSDIGLS